MLQREIFSNSDSFSQATAVSSAQAWRGQFYEFFAGGGMARAGLGSAWECLFANDIDPKKQVSYCRNWGMDEFKQSDVSLLTTKNLPAKADLAWASFPCQDLSLAGMGAGLNGLRSGTFWPFWNLVQGLAREDRQPSLIVLENVCGALTSHGGKDFQALISALADEGYQYGALIMDAIHFVPQSRPRLFIVAVREGIELPSALRGESPQPTWTSAALLKANSELTEEQRRGWIWWRMPAPPPRVSTLSELIEDEPTGVRWHTESETKRLLAMMSRINGDKLRQAMGAGRQVIGAVYKRTRIEAGERIQRAEVRFDDIAGCLRTPVGGSSRQVIMFVEGDIIRSRLISPREAARLMGLSEQYELPGNCNDAYHLVGDGLVAPAVRYLAANILEPVLEAARSQRREAA